MEDTLVKDVCTNTNLIYKNLATENRLLNKEVAILKEQVCLIKFSLYNITSDNSKIYFHTGYKFLWPAVNNLIYWNGKSTSSGVKGSGHSRSLTPKQEFFLVLVHLHLGLLEQDLIDHFEDSCSTVSRIFTI